ncbi:MAG: hypothetical protein L6Q92_09825 [Phycisphaerae bacterium]|nr:hypothetical protein [Phycisphaerae bacterium]
MSKVEVKRAVLWRSETFNSPGTLAMTLEPLANVKQDLQIVIGYAYPDRKSAAIEVYPVDGARAKSAAEKGGLHRSNFPCLIVSGANRPGLSHTIVSSLAEVGINLSFFIGQVIGRRYTALFGFEADSEADLAVKLIRKATNGAAMIRRGGVASARRRGRTVRRRGLNRTAARSKSRR